MQIICDIDRHFHPEDVRDRLNEQGHPISLTTVYRNSPLLIEAGIIRRVDISGQQDGGTAYEHVLGHDHHDHLVCSRCGKKVEFSYPAIEVLQDAIAREYGFELERHHLELVGVCAVCRESSDDEKSPDSIEDAPNT